MNPRRLLVWFPTLMLAACSTLTVPPEWSSLQPLDPSEVPFGELGRLQSVISGSSPDGRTIRFRGFVRNPYTQEVDGVRAVVRILTGPEAEARELERQERQMYIRIPGGGWTRFAHEIQTMYTGAKWVEVELFAVSRGGEEIQSPPKDLRTGLAVAAQMNTSGLTPPSSIVTNFMSGFR